jgi:hypothetical protein
VSCLEVGSAKGLHMLAPTEKTTNVVYKEVVLDFHHKNLQHLNSQE